MKKLPVLLIVLTLTGLITILPGCTFPQGNDAKAGLQLSGITTGVGGCDDTGDKSTLSYTASLFNDSSEYIYVKNVQVIPGGNVAPRIIGSQLIVNVEKYIPPGETLQVEGDFNFDSSGLSKTEITELEPYIKSFNITTEQLINVSNQLESNSGSQYANG